MYRIWVGKRESDIQTYDYFDYSITFYGSNNGNNKSFCVKNRINSSYSHAFCNFVVENIKKINSYNEKLEIHFYNNVFAHKIINECPEFEKFIVNLNPLSVLNTLRHKTLSRLWLNNCTDTPAFCLLSKKECVISNLKNKFGHKYNAFIIQKNYSGGGTGTYLIDNDNEDKIINELDEVELYLVSPFYFPNQSFSCHIFIDNEKCIVLPVSKQKLFIENSKMEYIGNTYINSKSEISNNIKQSAMKICKKLQSIKYRGICGFDFILTNDCILLIEINPRYQGSSFVINAALKENNLPSLFELNEMCFKNGIPDHIAAQISVLQIKYENTTLYYQNTCDINEANRLIKDKGKVVFLDGFSDACKFQKGSYLLRYISPCEEL